MKCIYCGCEELIPYRGWKVCPVCEPRLAEEARRWNAALSIINHKIDNRGRPSRPGREA